jgi:hypothetical protein
MTPRAVANGFGGIEMHSFGLYRPPIIAVTLLLVCTWLWTVPAWGTTFQDEVFSEAWVLVRPLSVALVGPAENYPTATEMTAHQAAETWASISRDLATIQMIPALEGIRKQALEDELRVSRAAYEADVAKTQGLTHLGAGAFSSFFCSKDDEGHESQACEITRKQAAKTIDNTVDYFTARSQFWSARKDFVQTVSNVSTALDAAGGAVQPAIGLAFHECCMRQSNQDFHYDLVEIRNASNEDLVSPIIRMRVIGQDGDHVDVWHYLDRLPAGTTVYSAYFQTMGFRGPRTVSNVARIEARIWSPNTQPQSFVLNYAGAEEEQDIAAFSRTLSARVDKYYPPDSSGYGGVAVSFTRHVHNPYSINITFRNGQQTCQHTEEWSDWTTDVPWNFKSKDLYCLPGEVLIYIRFKASSQWYLIGRATMR